jgi:hypothetical protein
MQASNVDKNAPKGGILSSEIASKVAVGEYIRWTSGGGDKFGARKVEWISPDRSFLRVFGSPTEIPMNEATVVNSPVPLMQESASGTTAGSKSPNISVYQVGGRLQITADVDATGIEKLESILAKYKEILKLMN